MKSNLLCSLVLYFKKNVLIICVSSIKKSVLKHFNTFKGPTKSYFTHYSCVVIVFFNTALHGSAFSTVSFRKLIFRLFVLFWIKTLKYASSCNVILICNFVLTLYKNSLFINNKLFIKILKYFVNAFRDVLSFLKKNSFIKKSV